MDKYPEYSWDDQDFKELQSVVLAGGPDESDIALPVADCNYCDSVEDSYICVACGHNPDCQLTDCCHQFEQVDDGLVHDEDCEQCEVFECCTAGGGEKCKICGQNSICEEIECEDSIHAITCYGCHKSDEPHEGRICQTCGHLEFCEEPYCDEPTHSPDAQGKRIASAEELALVRRLEELRDQKRGLEDEINEVREKLIGSTFSTAGELFGSPSADHPIAWAKYRENYSISNARKSKLKSQFPEVFREFFSLRKSYTIYLASSFGERSHEELDKP